MWFKGFDVRCRQFSLFTPEGGGGSLQSKMLLTTLKAKGLRKRGNIVAETLLRKHCFLALQMGKHLLKKQNVSEKSQKHFLFLGTKKCFHNKCFLSGQTRKHLGKQQCFRNNGSSFAGALRKLIFVTKATAV